LKFESVHYGFTKTLKGVLLTLPKDKISDSFSIDLYNI